MQHAAERVERPGESQEALDGEKRCEYTELLRLLFEAGWELGIARRTARSAKFPWCSWQRWRFREWRCFVARMILRLRRREWVRVVVVLAFPFSAERDNENFGAIFEHMCQLRMQQPQGHVRPRGHQGGESKFHGWWEWEWWWDRWYVRRFWPRREPRRAEPEHALPLLHSQQFVVEKETQKMQTLTALKPWTCSEPWKSRGRICKERCKMRYDHAFLFYKKRMEETRELAMEITRLESFQSFVWPSYITVEIAVIGLGKRQSVHVKWLLC